MREMYLQILISQLVLVQVLKMYLVFQTNSLPLYHFNFWTSEVLGLINDVNVQPRGSVFSLLELLAAGERKSEAG